MIVWQIKKTISGRTSSNILAIKIEIKRNDIKIIK